MVTYEMWDGAHVTVTNDEAKVIDRWRSEQLAHGAAGMVYRGKEQKKWAADQQRKFNK